jgi:hypothetical protein
VRSIIASSSEFENELHRGGSWLGKTGGAIGFALIPIAIGILWLLSFFQEKESNNAETSTGMIKRV